MNYFVYKLIPPRPTFGTDMTDSERVIMGRHMAYWSELAQKGTVIVFGPVADPHGSWGLAVVEEENEEAVKALGDADPAITSELATYEVYAMPAIVVRPAISREVA